MRDKEKSVMIQETGSDPVKYFWSKITHSFSSLDILEQCEKIEKV